IAVSVLVASAAVGVSARAASSAPDVASTGGVFVVTYAPVSVTNKMSELRVRFTTTGRAQPGWTYYVLLSIQRPKAKKPRCAFKAASWNPTEVRRVQYISGVPGQTYTVWLRAPKSLGGHFCAGAAVLDIGTAPAGHEESRRRLLRRVPLTVKRAR